MTKLLTTALCFSLLLCCCKNNDNSDKLSEHYDLSKARHGQLADIFSDVEVVPLEFAGNYYPNEIANMSINDSLILITDNLETVYLFEPNGSYISCSSEKQGEGPEEYPFSMGSAWNPNNNTIQIITPYKIILYDKYFNYITSYKIPLFPGKEIGEKTFFHYIYPISNTSSLLRTSDIPYNLTILNFDTEKFENGISYKDDVITDRNAQSNIFFEKNDKTLYFVPCSMTNRIYVFDTDSLTINPIVEFSTGSNGVTKEYIASLNMSQKEIAYHLATCDRDMLLNAMPNEDHIVTMLSHGKTLHYYHYVFIDRNTGEMTRIDMYKNGHLNMPMFKDIDNKYAYAVALKEDIAEMPWILLNKETDADSILNNIEEDTYLILKYRFLNAE